MFECGRLAGPLLAWDSVRVVCFGCFEGFVVIGDSFAGACVLIEGNQSVLVSETRCSSFAGHS